ncbi:methyl-accepting chemotaxis protein [Geobacter sp. AOG2]|uniref:methyl-accepting chemotaxis protein n=1 Tax=Geobacter sp. AOG2 TaxID=1566347 RepID=UPI001CC4E516|nr:methyl-accepting chemotaxis protein [Geobacter sp. AOG2]GFE59867.1 hypothetical protein AOG2_04550 [Geobacter sp. AOG2]
MKIKTKLFLNVAIVAGISIIISVTCYVSMTFIKEKLAYLTEKSTPYQLRTLEYERSIQAATADLVKVSTSRFKKELDDARAEAAKSLETVKTSQTTIESMSGEKFNTYSELEDIFNRLVETVTASIVSEEDANNTAKATTQHLNETIAKLKELDGLVKALQASRSATYVTFVEGRNSYADKLTSLEMAKAQLKDTMVLCFQSQRGNVKGYKSEVKGHLDRLQQNGNVRGNQKLKAAIASLSIKLDEYFTLRIAGNRKADGMIDDLLDKLDGIIGSLDNEIDNISEKVADITGKNGNSFAQANITVSALSSNSELLAYGSSVDGLVTRLFTATTEKEIDTTLATIAAQYTKIHKAESELQKHLKKLNAVKELAVLNKTISALDGVYANLTAKGGIVPKLKNRLAMQEVASQESVKLRNIVMQQAQESRQTSSVAQGEQEKSIAAVNSMIRKSLGLILTIGALAVLSGIIFGIWMYRAIARPLSRLISTTREIASGNLNCTISAESNDEIGQVQKEMATMTGSLQNIAKKIGVATDTLAGSSEELSSTARTLENSTEQQTERIEQSAAAMTEMSQTINDVSNNANETADTAASMRETANRGRDRMHTAVSQLNQFAETIKSSALEVETLGTQSEKITGIVALINDIADQTNLLALNAAIEAARAGEQGRGFAVVADEVRKLAARTSEATEEIVESVSSMNTGVGTAVKLIREESSSVDQVVNIVNESVQSIDEIVENMDKITGMIGRIAVAAQQQSATSDEISRVMNTISDVARQIKSAFVDVKQSSENLAATASDLNDTAKWFRL